MREHHRKAAERMVDLWRDREELLAIIVGGSVAKGTARASSDVDVYMVMTDQEFEARRRVQDLFYYNPDICDYEGGYIDGKIIPYSFVVQAEQRGSEPTRASFIGSEVFFSRIPDLQALVDRIPVYPEANRERNMRDFYAQVLLYGRYFAKQAIDQDNEFMLRHAVSQLVLFASRMLLAYNRVLFPCHKSLMAATAQATQKPDGYMDAADQLLREPSKERIDAFLTMISDYQEWGITYDQAVSLFVENNEWSWLEQEPAIQDR